MEGGHGKLLSRKMMMKVILQRATCSKGELCFLSLHRSLWKGCGKGVERRGEVGRGGGWQADLRCAEEVAAEGGVVLQAVTRAVLGRTGMHEATGGQMKVGR